MLKALKLSNQMKNDDDMEGAVLLACEMVLEPTALDQLRNDIKSGKVRVPGKGALRTAKQKLDVVAMHWMVQQYASYDISAYDIIDSSPQNGWNFLVVRTDEFLFPKNASFWVRLTLDLGTIFQQRTLPLTCVGYGKGALHIKLGNYCHSGLLESQDLDKWLSNFHGVI